jgi:hypothetical protein
LLEATLYQASIKPPLGPIDAVDYLLGATLYQASIKPPLGTIDDAISSMVPSGGLMEA